MHPSPLRDRVKARPFVPFAVTLSDGRQVRVTVPEMIILGKRWDTTAFVDEEGYDRIVLLHHDHISAIDPMSPRTPTD